VLTLVESLADSLLQRTVSWTGRRIICKQLRSQDFQVDNTVPKYGIECRGNTRILERPGSTADSIAAAVRKNLSY